MTTKVEPTVEKIHQPVIEAMKKIGYGLLKDGETFYQLGYELEPRQGITFTMSQAYVITHSLQEAKAEMIGKIKNIPCHLEPPQGGSGGGGRQFVYLDDLLAYLKPGE